MTKSAVFPDIGKGVKIPIERYTASQLEGIAIPIGSGDLQERPGWARVELESEYSKIGKKNSRLISTKGQRGFLLVPNVSGLLGKIGAVLRWAGPIAEVIQYIESISFAAKVLEPARLKTAADDAMYGNSFLSDEHLRPIEGLQMFIDLSDKTLYAYSIDKGREGELLYSIQLQQNGGALTSGRLTVYEDAGIYRLHVSTFDYWDQRPGK